MTEVAAVVVNYKTAALTVGCVASLRADGVDEVVVVDSGSGDDCRERLAAADPAAMFVPFGRNIGYGPAANAGVRRTGAPVVIVANPDLVVRAGTAPALAAALASDPRLGVVGPRIDRPDGTRYPSARAFPSLLDALGHGFAGLVTTDNPWSRRYLRTGAEEAGPSDWVSGAFFAARREAWDAVGGFDEGYFMFMEDVDLCWRLRRAGWGVAYEPAGLVTHLEGASRAAAPYRMILAHHRSLLRYGWRTGSWGERLLLPVVAVGLAVRGAIMAARAAALTGHPDGRRLP
ncbi:MAG TPA: glycosyltransferase family 2 protein [Acidimicrobiales bacterium]|nr:glycosyltransferase family 2 protein [Acidimicrobiales bacterium]